jgi:hypothetical protein
MTVVASLAVAGTAAMPAAHAGLSEATDPPAAYVVNGDDFPDECGIARLDLGSGDLEDLPVTSPETCSVGDLAVAPDGSLWGISDPSIKDLNVLLVEFDTTTGAVLSATPISGDFAETNIAIGGLAFDGAGTLYVQLVTDGPGCEETAVCLYTVDPTTAEATFVGNPAPDFEETLFAYLAADCGSSLLTTVPEIVAAGASTSWVEPALLPGDGNLLGSYDKASGALASDAELPEDQFAGGLDYSRGDGTLYALLTPVLAPVTDDTTDATDDVGARLLNLSLYTVDPETGQVTLVTALSQPESNLAFLAIAGDCVAPPTPAPPPIVLEPTFTG